ncbi:hypothetical protein SLE2022_371410 [Rubroshorea leprosula]
MVRVCVLIVLAVEGFWAVGSETLLSGTLTAGLEVIFIYAGRSKFSLAPAFRIQAYPTPRPVKGKPVALDPA